MIAGKLPQEMIFITPVPKNKPKVDIFASCKYEDDKVTPKSSVVDQGAQTFGKKMLVPMLADIYSIDWEETKYVDLVVLFDKVMKSHNDLYAIPKVISGGEHKGQPTYQTRENLTICPLVIFEGGTSSAAPVNEAEAVASNDTVVEEEMVAEETFSQDASANTEVLEESEPETTPIADAGPVNPFAQTATAPVPTPDPEPTEFGVPGVDAETSDAAGAGADWANGMGNIDSYKA